VAARLRMVHGRKRSPRKRPAKRKRTRLGIVGLALLAALILGFLTKRVMIPSAVHYIAYRPPDHPNADNTTSEQLTPSDRSKLDTIIKEKSKR
jgi:hypothetical protein